MQCKEYANIFLEKESQEGCSAETKSLTDACRNISKSLTNVPTDTMDFIEKNYNKKEEKYKMGCFICILQIKDFSNEIEKNYQAMFGAVNLVGKKCKEKNVEYLKKIIALLQDKTEKIKNCYKKTK